MDGSFLISMIMDDHQYKLPVLTIGWSADQMTNAPSMICTAKNSARKMNKLATVSTVKKCDCCI